VTPSDWLPIAVPSRNGDDYPPLRQCESCGRSIDGYRRQARYCGGPCRAAASCAETARRTETLGHEGRRLTSDGERLHRDVRVEVVARVELKAAA
jgi:ribosome-binding protein aMBF1 (putative translation factor)